MILIVGDSWGCGEWDNMNITHNGLAQYIREDGTNVINLSLGGSSNWEIYERLQLFFDSGTYYHLNESIDLILIFQTEWHRDLNHQKITCAKNHVAENAIVCWLYRLSEIATKNNVQIGLIGGCSDTILFDNFNKEHPGLFVACQSFTNLCINNDSQIVDPTFLIRPDEYLIPILKDLYLKHSTVENFINDIDKGEIRNKLWRDHPEYFWPDGVHPNRLGHKKLFNFLKNSGIIQ